MCESLQAVYTLLRGKSARQLPFGTIRIKSNTTTVACEKSIVRRSLVMSFVSARLVNAHAIDFPFPFMLSSCFLLIELVSVIELR